MEKHHPNYLIFLNTQVPDPLYDYEPLNLWLNEHYRTDVHSVGSTAHAILIRAKEPLTAISTAIESRLGKPDSLHVIPVEDFAWPSAPPDDETLLRWLKTRDDWAEWSEGHS